MAYWATILASTPLSSADMSGSEPGSWRTCLRPWGDRWVKMRNFGIGPGLGRRRGRFPDRLAEGIDAHRREGADLDGAARAELDRDAGDHLVAGCLDHVDEVVAAQDGVLGRDPAAHGLDLLVHLRQPLGTLFQRLATFIGQLAEQDVGWHQNPRVGCTRTINRDDLL